MKNLLTIEFSPKWYPCECGTTPPPNALEPKPLCKPPEPPKPMPVVYHPPCMCVWAGWSPLDRCPCCPEKKSLKLKKKFRQKTPFKTHPLTRIHHQNPLSDPMASLNHLNDYQVEDMNQASLFSSSTLTTTYDSVFVFPLFSLLMVG